MSPWIIYLWGAADKIVGTLEFSAFLSGASAALLIIAYFICLQDMAEDDKAIPVIKKWRNRAIVVFFLFFTLQAVTPSSKTVALMVIVPAVLNSEPIQQDLPELYQMAKEALKQTLETK